MKLFKTGFCLLIFLAGSFTNLHARDVWIGTAPFCKGKKSDCTKRGMKYIKRSKKGDGKKCFSGYKVLCRSVKRKPPKGGKKKSGRRPRRIWIGTAPFCKGKKRDCTSRGMKYVRRSKRGDGKKCMSGYKVLCEAKPLPKGKYRKWFGTAPACAASKADCINRGMKYIRSHKSGDGKSCITGKKVLCEGDKNAPPIKWIGTAPICKGRRSDCESRDMNYVGKSRTGTGARCTSGHKVMCRGRPFAKFNRGAANPNEILVLNANIFSRPFIVSHDGQTERLAHIPRIFGGLARAKIDVIVFQEAFLTNGRFKRDMRRAGFVYKSGILPAKALKGQFSNGGVQIFSRWPIVRQSKKKYKNCNGSDCYASKGVIYVRIKKSVRGKTRYYSIFGTHMQAWNTKKGRNNRYRQGRELRGFINRMRVPRGEIVVIAGDLNADFIRHRGEANKLLGIIKGVMPRFADRNRVTSEPKTNALVGADGTASDNKCENFYHKRKYCRCCKNEYLDYVLYSRTHRKPSFSSIRILKPKARPFAACMSAKVQPHHVEPYSPFCKRTWKIRDLSDHYPVLGTFRY